MKTVMVLIAGAMIASMSMAAANGPSADEQARVKYGWTRVIHAAPVTSGVAALPRAEQWSRAKFGRVTIVPAHICRETGCVGTTVATVSDREARMMEKYGRAVPAPVEAACDHACCQRGE
jgi:hypothetical protein